MATKVDSHGFRAGLADYIAPARAARDAELAALRAAGAKLDGLLNLSQDEVDDAVTEFRELRRSAR